MITYNEELKQSLIKEMERVSKIYRIGNKWGWEPAKEYHDSMYRILELMVNFPVSIGEV